MSKVTLRKYSKDQIDFLVHQKDLGATSVQAAKAFKKKFAIEKSPSAIRNLWASYHGVECEVGEQEYSKTAEGIMESFLATVARRRHVPKQKDFLQEIGIPRHHVAAHYDSYTNLEEQAREEHPEVFEQINDEASFTSEAWDSLVEEVTEYQRFVITSAVTGCAPNKKGLKTLLKYCEYNDAKLLVLPCSDPAKTQEHKHKFSIHHDIPSDSIVFRDLQLNESLTVSTIKLSAKQILPLTGLKRMGLHNSCIFASPKQMLEHVPHSNKKEVPKAIMTTGAITDPDYHTEMYMSERTAYIANQDHKLGAVIVEIKNDKTFFYRRIEINPKTGAFCDLNKKYHANGHVEKIGAEVINQPDWHTISTDPDFKEVAQEITEVMQPKFMTFEDFFDGYSINPHEKQNIILRNQKQRQEAIDLETELQLCANEIADILNWDGDFRVIFKYGNHEDFLSRWLTTAGYAQDPVNHYTGVCLAKAMMEDNAPFEWAMRNLFDIEGISRCEFLGVNDSLIINGIENAVHGHLGASGKRNPTLAGLEAYGPCTTGHTHSAGILRDVVRVGTATYPQLVYNNGASAWTQTLCIQHFDGSRQLITSINGEWCLPDIIA